MQVVIPCAGLGSRFSEANYVDPKPFIPIPTHDNKPMIEVVIENLGFNCKHILLIRQEHMDYLDKWQQCTTLDKEIVVVPVESVTEGAACTVLLAEHVLDPFQPMILANSDQYVEDFDPDAFSRKLTYLDGVIATFTPAPNESKWSYVRVDEYEAVLEVVEKKIISDIATIGIYGWAKASYFINSAKQMIAQNIRTNGEYYVAPTFQELINNGRDIGIHHLEQGSWGIGTPEDLQQFLTLVREGKIK